MDKIVDAEVIPFSRTRNVEDVVRRLGEMFREHMIGYADKIKELTDRIEDLEGHAEHGPAGTCGICDPEDDEPETVSAGEYGSIITADFDGECAHPFCDDVIMPGDEVQIMDEGKFIHDQCRGQ